MKEYFTFVVLNTNAAGSMSRHLNGMAADNWEYVSTIPVEDGSIILLSRDKEESDNGDSDETTEGKA